MPINIYNCSQSRHCSKGKRSIAILKCLTLGKAIVYIFEKISGNLGPPNAHVHSILLMLDGVN